MNELLTQAAGPLIAFFLVVAMFSLGLDLTLRQIVDSLGNRRLVMKSLLTNIIGVPLLAITITSLVPMHDGLRIGIVLYAIAAGTEGGPKFVHISNGNTALAFGLLVLMLMFTVTLVPTVLPLVLPGAAIHIGPLLAQLLLVVALPIAVGLYLKARHQAIADRLSPPAHRLAMFLLYGLFVLLIYINFREMIELQASALLAGLLFFALAFGAGYLAGGPDKQNRRTLGIMTFARNGSISMLIAREVFADDPQVLMMATIMTVCSVILAVLIVTVSNRL